MDDGIERPSAHREVLPSGDHRQMATGESVAHLNYLIADGQMTVEPDAHGVLWYRRTV